jgi:proteasome lid subunit RPN8/RPN11
VTATPRLIVLSALCRAQLLNHARRNVLHECCGLLIGHGSDEIVVDEIQAAKNIAAQPERGFEIDPQIQFEALRRLRGTNRRVIGHYHSHPGGPLQPSVTDLAMAHDPEAIWLIVTPEGEGAVAAFVCRDPAVGFVPVVISVGQ